MCYSTLTKTYARHCGKDLATKPEIQFLLVLLKVNKFHYTWFEKLSISFAKFVVPLSKKRSLSFENR